MLTLKSTLTQLSSGKKQDMASLRDDDLWKLVRNLNVVKLKELLGKVGVPTTAVKEKLQQRLFYAVRLGLEILPTQAEEDKQVSF